MKNLLKNIILSSLLVVFPVKAFSSEHPYSSQGNEKKKPKIEVVVEPSEEEEMVINIDSDDEETKEKKRKEHERLKNEFLPPSTEDEEEKQLKEITLLSNEELTPQEQYELEIQNAIDRSEKEHSRAFVDERAIMLGGNIGEELTPEEVEAIAKSAPQPTYLGTQVDLEKLLEEGNEAAIAEYFAMMSISEQPESK